MCCAILASVDARGALHIFNVKRSIMSDTSLSHSKKENIEFNNDLEKASLPRLYSNYMQRNVSKAAYIMQVPTEEKFIANAPTPIRNKITRKIKKLNEVLAGAKHNDTECTAVKKILSLHIISLYIRESANKSEKQAQESFEAFSQEECAFFFQEGVADIHYEATGLLLSLVLRYKQKNRAISSEDLLKDVNHKLEALKFPPVESLTAFGSFQKLFVSKQKPTFTKEQKKIIKIIHSHVYNDTGPKFEVLPSHFDNISMMRAFDLLDQLRNEDEYYKASAMVERTFGSWQAALDAAKVAYFDRTVAKNL
jgi:hypothetical protein